MSRLLSLSLLAVVLWVFLEIGWARLKTRLGPHKTTELVRCARCGVYAPRSRAATGAEGFICERCRA